MTKQMRNAYDRKYRQNPRYYTDRRARDFFRAAIQGQATRSKYESILGYTVAEFLQHIAAQLKPGMSFANFGQWHVDHIHGRVNYEYSTVDCPGFVECYRLENLQPLWKAENLTKRKKDARRNTRF